MMKTTFTATKANITNNWLIVDATDLTVGRLASEVAILLRGKHKPTFTPNVDCGDYVIIINADKVKFTGKKMTDKIYYRHTGHPGGLKETTARDLLARRPERIMELAVRGMLPKNKLGRQMYKKMFVYAGAEHAHAAQQPKEYTLKG